MPNPATPCHWQVMVHGPDPAVTTRGPIWTLTTGNP